MPDPTQEWIKAGTPTEEPVTIETPATPQVEPAAVEPVTPARDEAGRFTSPSPSTPAPETPTPAEVIEYMLQGKIGDKEFGIPKGLTIPLKRGETVEYEPFENVIKERLMARDYTIKTTEVAQERAQLAKEKAALEAERAWLTDEQKRLEGAYTDENQAADLQEHFRLMRESPRYAEAFEAARAKRQADAELQTYRDRDYQEEIQSYSQRVVGWIQELAPRFPGVSPERVRVLYAQYLQSQGETGTIHPSDVQRIFEQEAHYLAQSVTPFQSEIDELKRQVETLLGQTATDAHNKQTQHAVDRAKAPSTAPITGAPPAPQRQPPRPAFGRNQLAQVNADWANQR